MINFSTDDVGSADWLCILFLELWGYSIEVRNAQSNDSSTTHYRMDKGFSILTYTESF